MGLVGRLVKNTGYLAVGNQLGNLVQFVFFLYFARTFGEAAVGQYSFAFSFTYVFAVIANLGISIYLIREIARDRSGSRQLFFDGLVMRILSISILFGIALVVIRFFFKDFSEEMLRIIGFLGLYQVLFSLADVFAGEFKGRERMGLISLIGLSSKSVTGIGGFLLIALGLPYSLVLVVFPIGGLFYLVTCIVISRYSFGPVSAKFRHLTHYKRLFLNVLPFGITIALVEIMFCQDILILRFLRGDTSVGVYSVAVKITGMIIGVSLFLHTAMLPILSRLFVESRSKLIEVSERMLKYLIIASLPLSVGLVTLSDRIIRLLYQDKFGDSILVLRIVGWMVTIGLVQTIFSALLPSINRQKEKAICYAINLVISVTLNLSLIHYLDYLGASIARLITEIITTALFFFVVSKYLVILPMFKLALKPVLACIAMAVFIYYGHNWNLAFLIPLSGIIYLISLFALGTFTQEEIATIKSVGLKKFYVSNFRE